MPHTSNLPIWALQAGFNMAAQHVLIQQSPGRVSSKQWSAIGTLHGSAHCEKEYKLDCAPARLLKATASHR